MSTTAEEDVVVWSDPPCQLLVRTKSNVLLYETPERRRPSSRSNSNATIPPPAPGGVELWNGGSSASHVTPDGTYAYLITGEGVVQIHIASKTTKLLPNSKSVQILALSPSGVYATTWERSSSSSASSSETSATATTTTTNNNNNLNLKVWKNDGSLVAAFYQKSFNRNAWPTIQWTHDEQFVFLLVANEIRVFPVGSMAMVQKKNLSSDDGETTQSSSSNCPPRYTHKLHIPGIASFSLPSQCTSKTTTVTGVQHSYLFTTFCVGNKNQPAKASLHEFVPSSSSSPSSSSHNNINGSSGVSSSSSSFNVVLSKSLFQADEMKTYWSPVGDAALISMQTSVDTTGQSYYGGSQLFLLSTSGPGVPGNHEAVAVPCGTPVLDVSWMPHPDKPPCFAVVSGNMPALATLHHDQTAQPVFIFGNAHRNTIAWSPHGRFVTLAGFGNLPGGMGFWDRNKLKLIPHCALNASGRLQAENATTFGWSPDSRLFVTATCSPRMNVDNGIRLWRYTGEQFTNQVLPWDNTLFQPNKLLSVQFVPALLKSYPDRPQSPIPAEVATALTTSTPNDLEPHCSKSNSSMTYIPPSARNRRAVGGGLSLAERMRKAKEDSMQQATKVSPNHVTPSSSTQTVSAPVVAKAKPLPVGMTATPKSKHALKREKQKVKKQQQDNIVEQPQQLQQQHQSASSHSESLPLPATTTTTNASWPSNPPSFSSMIVVDPEKRARKLNKLLKQIEDLQLKSPDTLNDDQKAKLASEASVRAELAELNM